MPAEAAKPGTGEPEAQPPTSVTYHYVKSPLFRSVHADAVWGGVTPRGYVSATFVSERNPIPRAMTYAIDSEGRRGEEVRALRESRDGIVREVEVTLYMDLAMAKSYIAWLQEKVEILEEALHHQDPPSVSQEDAKG